MQFFSRKYIFSYLYKLLCKKQIAASYSLSWEQRKLGDVVKEITRNDPESEAPIMMITANNGFIEQSERYAFNNAGESLKKYILLKKGELAYNHGASKLRPYGSCFALTTAENARIPFVYHCFSAENQNAEFMSIELNGAEIENQLRKIVSSGARMDGLLNISFDEYTSVSVILPGTEEQDRIADFFRHLDNLITLHQRQHFLHSTPDISLSVRLIHPFYTSSWEQRKLGELVDRVVRKNINNESTLPLTISAQYGLVDQITYFNNRVASRDVSNYYLVLNGEFAYNKSTSDGYPFGAVKRLDLYEKGVLSTLYIVFAPKKEQQIDSDYLTVFFDTDRWHKGVAERAAEGARNHGLLNISAEDFFDIDLSVPKDIVEQKQIGAFIRQLDNLITLHQRECISFTARAGRLILTANKKRNTSSWEQRKVQDVADRFDNLRIPVAANLRVHGTTPYYGANGIQDYVEGFTHDGEFVLVAEDGANDLKNYPVKCVNGRIWVNNHAHVLQEKAGIADNSFLAFAISQSDIESLLVGGGRAKLNAETIMSIEFRLPCLQEQYRIGEYLTQLDHLITLHQRKCANLCSPSQVVFSLLFATSTFSWEQRKLGELVDRVVRKNINNESTLPLTISAQYGLVDQITYFNNRVASRDVSNYYLVLNGEFAYNKSTSDGYPFGAVKRLDLYEKGVLSTLYIVFAPKKEQQIDSDYLTVFFDTDRWHKGVAERAAEGARNHGLLNISAEDFFDIDLSVPKDIVEQKQIGAFIRQLDNLITLHQRECISFTARAGRLILTANKKRNTSSWEQRKVQDVADRFDNLRIPVAANLRVHGTTPYYGANGIQDYVEGFTHDGEFVLVAEDGANDLKNYPVKCVNGRIWVNNHAHVLQEKAGIADNSFLAFAISQSDIESLLVGGGRAKLNAETIMSIEFRLPCLQEQYRIGEYLTQLDHLITLHQRKPFLMKWRTSDANRNQTNRLVL